MWSDWCIMQFMIIMQLKMTTPKNSKSTHFEISCGSKSLRNLNKLYMQAPREFNFECFIICWYNGVEKSEIRYFVVHTESHIFSWNHIYLLVCIVYQHGCSYQTKESWNIQFLLTMCELYCSIAGCRWFSSCAAVSSCFCSAKWIHAASDTTKCVITHVTFQDVTWGWSRGCKRWDRKTILESCGSIT